MISQAWGKTDRNDPSKGFHPLAHHSMDVAATFQRMMELPVIRNRLEETAETSLSDIQCKRLAALVFLHDIGKLHPGFQAKRLSREDWHGARRGHLEEGWAFFKFAYEWQDHPFHATMQQILGWGETAVEPLLAATIAHHGHPVTLSGDPTLTNDWDRSQPPNYSWREETRLMDGMFRRWFSKAFEKSTATLPDSHRFHHLFAGFVALADWIGSNQRFFEFRSPLDPTYDVVAHSQAAKALEAIHLDPRTIALSAVPDFTTLTTFRKPNPAQAVVGNISSAARLLILEAETGSGKTEAALWRFVQLLAAGKVSGLYFAVPTRAAARQLHGRIVKAIGRVFGKAGPEPVLAIPGQLRAGEHEGQRLPDWEVRWDDDSEFVSRRWAAEHATRFLSAMIAVGTIDQAMLAALTVKHAHMRGSALSRSLLVIDEVHASDAYMTEIQKALLDAHLGAGGYAMLMSATLGARARVGWTRQSMPNFEAAAGTPYPAIWIQEESTPYVPATTGRSRDIHMEAVPTMNPMEAASRAIAAAQCGARVLVIRNTVTSAVETWRAVLTANDKLLLRVGEGPALHHGRFFAEDRVLLDHAVETALDAKSPRDGQGCIVIGTQTLEQSLDIDADLLITDLCPVDVLLQRIGRLHRHSPAEGSRPFDFEIARAVILIPEEGLDRLTEPAFENGLGAWKTKDGGINGIYRDLAGLELTRCLIRDRDVWRIPEMNRVLVESATHPERISSLIARKGEDWDRYERQVGGSRLAESRIAELNILYRGTEFCGLQFQDQDEGIMTRLGEEGIILSLETPVRGPFGSPVSRIALPARWSRGISDDDLVATKPVGEDLNVCVGDRRFRYSRAGLNPEKSEGALQSEKN